MARERSISDWEAERAVFGTAHDEVGGYLLWLWGLPDAITEIVAGHHRLPSEPAPTASPLVAVHLADELINTGSDQHLDPKRLAAFGLPDHLADWTSVREEIIGGNKC